MPSTATRATFDRLDSHVHFWRYDAQDYPWIAPADAVLAADWLPDALERALDGCGVSGVVAVQARPTERDNAWLMALASRNPWIRAVVGWVDFKDPNALDAMDRWCAASVFRGFRPMLQGCADPGAVCQNSVFSGNVQGLQARGLVFELLLRAPQLACAPAFCARHSGSPIILDHLGKPAIESAYASDAFHAWRKVMVKLAAMPHVFVKLSGLMSELAHPVEKGADHAWQRVFGRIWTRL